MGLIECDLSDILQELLSMRMFFVLFSFSFFFLKKGKKIITGPFKKFLFD